MLLEFLLACILAVGTAFGGGAPSDLPRSPQPAGQIVVRSRTPQAILRNDSSHSLICPQSFPSAPRSSSSPNVSVVSVTPASQYYPSDACVFHLPTYMLLDLESERDKLRDYLETVTPEIREHLTVRRPKIRQYRQEHLKAVSKDFSAAYPYVDNSPLNNKFIFTFKVRKMIRENKLEEAVALTLCGPQEAFDVLMRVLDQEDPVLRSKYTYIQRNKQARKEFLRRGLDMHWSYLGVTNLRHKFLLDAYHGYLTETFEEQDHEQLLKEFKGFHIRTAVKPLPLQKYFSILKYSDHHELYIRLFRNADDRSAKAEMLRIAMMYDLSIEHLDKLVRDAPVHILGKVLCATANATNLMTVLDAIPDGTFKTACLVKFLTQGRTDVISLPHFLRIVRHLAPYAYQDVYEATLMNIAHNDILHCDLHLLHHSRDSVFAYALAKAKSPFVNELAAVASLEDISRASKHLIISAERREQLCALYKHKHKMGLLFHRTIRVPENIPTINLCVAPPGLDSGSSSLMNPIKVQLWRLLRFIRDELTKEFGDFALPQHYHSSRQKVLFLIQMQAYDELYRLYMFRAADKAAGVLEFKEYILYHMIMDEAAALKYLTLAFIRSAPLEVLRGTLLRACAADLAHMREKIEEGRVRRVLFLMKAVKTRHEESCSAVKAKIDLPQTFYRAFIEMNWDNLVGLATEETVPLVVEFLQFAQVNCSHRVFDKLLTSALIGAAKQGKQAWLQHALTTQFFDTNEFAKLLEAAAPEVFTYLIDNVFPLQILKTVKLEDVLKQFVLEGTILDREDGRRKPSGEEILLGAPRTWPELAPDPVVWTDPAINPQEQLQPLNSSISETLQRIRNATDHVLNELLTQYSWPQVMVEMRVIGFITMTQRALDDETVSVEQREEFLAAIIMQHLNPTQLQLIMAKSEDYIGYPVEAILGILSNGTEELVAEVVSISHKQHINDAFLRAALKRVQLSCTNSAQHTVFLKSLQWLLPSLATQLHPFVHSKDKSLFNDRLKSIFVSSLPFEENLSLVQSLFEYVTETDPEMMKYLLTAEKRSILPFLLQKLSPSVMAALLSRNQLASNDYVKYLEGCYGKAYDGRIEPSFAMVDSNDSVVGSGGGKHICPESAPYNKFIDDLCAQCVPVESVPYSSAPGWNKSKSDMHKGLMTPPKAILSLPPSAPLTPVTPASPAVARPPEKRPKQSPLTDMDEIEPERWQASEEQDEEQAMEEDNFQGPVGRSAVSIDAFPLEIGDDEPVLASSGIAAARSRLVAAISLNVEPLAVVEEELDAQSAQAIAMPSQAIEISSQAIAMPSQATEMSSQVIEMPSQATEMPSQVVAARKRKR